jgi:Sigma-70 factor, region 1.1
MASKTKVTPQKEEMLEKQGPETPPDSPLLDLSDAAVKKLIRTAKKRGYVTHDQINSVLPSEGVNSEQIEDVLDGRDRGGERGGGRACPNFSAVAATGPLQFDCSVRSRSGDAMTRVDRWHRQRIPDTP